MPHEDGPIYVPTIATISLGSHTVLNFYEKRGDGENRDQGERTGQADAKEHALDHGGEDDGSDDSVGVGVEEEKDGKEEREQRPIARLLLEQNSLVITRGRLYHVLHGIDEVARDTLPCARCRSPCSQAGGEEERSAPPMASHCDACDGAIANIASCCCQLPPGSTLERGTRVSLTIRRVLKTKKLKGFSFLTGRK